MFGQSLLSAFGIACTTDTDQLFVTTTSTASLATYQLNNATTSIPSNTYPGTASNITYGTGKFGNAASFNGSSSYIRLPANFLNSSTQTISMWVNPSSVSGNGMLYSSYDYQTGPSKGTYMRLNSGGQIQFTVHDGDCSTMYPDNPSCTAVTQLISPSSITVNTWTHVVGVIGGSGNPMAIYINGVKVISTATMRSVGYWSGKQPLIGATDYVVNGTSYPPEAYFNGSIDQVRFFSSVLSQAAITALYNETTTTATSASVDYPAPNPNSVAYYKMSDATDQLGNYNGTATNVNFNTEGKFGFAGAFNGSSSKIVLPTTTLDSIKSNGSFGVSAWFKTSETGDRKCIFSAFESSYLMLEVTSGNQLKGIVSNTSGTNTELTVPITVTDGNWHHAVFTGNNGSLSLYLDNGTPQTSSSWNGTFFSGTGGTGIGIRMASSDHWDGDIDQIRLYDAVLSASNVSTLYKEVECEPAAINALDQFNTVLYTGNNTTNVINTVGFEPGLLWVKTRDDNKNHVLVDTVRGISSVLEADTPAAAVTGYTDVTSFDPNGFTLAATSAVYMNPAGIDMVSWNWKAPLANLSSSFNGSSSYISLPAGINKNNNFSWSFWYMFNTHTYYDTPIGFFMNGYTNFIDTPSSGELSFYDGNSRLTTPSSTFTAGTWYHVVVTKSSTAGRKFYVNGSVVATDSGNSNSGSSSGGRNLIGAYSSSGNPTSIALEFDGKLAQVRIFDDALTAGEVSDLYTEPATSNNTLNYPAGAGCIAAYPLQTDAVDLSGNYSGASSNVTFGQPGYLTGNTNGTIPSTVAANVDAGFSIVKYTGNGTAGATIGHGLGSKPELFFIKQLNATRDWIAWCNEDNTKLGYLNHADSFENSRYSWALNSTQPTSTTITFSNDASTNGSSNEYIAYCFKSIAGYSKVGSYTSTYPSTTSVYVGFQPRFVMIKSYNQARNWVTHDSTRTASKQLYPNLPNNEADTGTQLQFTSTGFNVSGGSNDLDGGSSYSYIFLAIA